MITTKRIQLYIVISLLCAFGLIPASITSASPLEIPDSLKGDTVASGYINTPTDQGVLELIENHPSVTLLKNNNITIRSLEGRYNQFTMDGVALPGTELQGSILNFIPSELIDTVELTKTATSDSYSNFLGGAVALKTKVIPVRNFISVMLGTSYNSASTFQDFITTQNGNIDFLGFDDGTRDNPGFENIDIPATEDDAAAFLNNSQKFTQDNFTNYTTNAPMSTAFQLAVGRSYNLPGNKRWGFTGAFSFKNNQTSEIIDHTERGGWKSNTVFADERETGDFPKFTQYTFFNTGGNYTYTAAMNGMLNAGLEWGNNRLSLRNTYYHSYNNSLTQIIGWDNGDLLRDNSSTSDPENIIDETLPPRTETVTYPIYQTYIQNQLEGNHRFNTLDFDWLLGRSHTSREIKDATFSTIEESYYGDEDESACYITIDDENPNLYRLFNTYEETAYNFAASLKADFEIANSEHTVKAGYNGSLKTAENMQERAEICAVTATSDQSNATIRMPFDELLDGSHYKWGGYGWKSNGFYGDQYEGKESNHALYLMLDHRLLQKVNIVWGVRAEYYQYTQANSQYFDSAYLATQQEDPIWQLLPSFNIIFSPHADFNISLAYNKSVLHPGFADRLQVPLYDPVRAATIMNAYTGIVSSVADNYNFNVSYQPASGEIIAAGVYYKDIDKPIETMTSLVGDSARTICTVNSQRAEIFGVDFELRKCLSFMGEGVAVENIYLLGSAAFNWTTVTAYKNLEQTEEYPVYEVKRPLTGQAPYVIKLGFEYTGERLGLSYLWNYSAEQCLTAGYDYEDEEIRMAFNTVDIQAYYCLLKDKNLVLKAYANNIFNSVIKTYNNANSHDGEENSDYDGTNERERYKMTHDATDKYDRDIDPVKYNAHKGVTLGLSIKYNF